MLLQLCLSSQIVILGIGVGRQCWETMLGDNIWCLALSGYHDSNASAVFGITCGFTTSRAVITSLQLLASLVCLQYQELLL